MTNRTAPQGNMNETTKANRWNDPKWLRKELSRAEMASIKRSEARAALPPGSSRARVTSANAAWARAAEYRDLIRARVDALESAMANRAESGIAPAATSSATVRVAAIAIDVEGDDAMVAGALAMFAAAVEGK